MREHRAELDAIALQSEAPSFANTVSRLDASGRAFARIDGVFHNLCASETNDALQAAQRELAQPMAAHSNAMYLNAQLFARLDDLHAHRAALGLDAQGQRLLEQLHSDFVRAGARLAGAERERFAERNERLAALMTSFGQNVLADEASYRLSLKTEADMAGLPAFVRDAARQAAADRGLEGAVITLSRSLIVPFLTFSERRDLREAAWRAWTSRGEHDGPTDNRPVIREILELRAEQARRVVGAEPYMGEQRHQAFSPTLGANAQILWPSGSRRYAP